MKGKERSVLGAKDLEKLLHAKNKEMNRLYIDHSSLEARHEALIEEAANMSKELIRLREREKKLVLLLEDQIEGTSRLVADCDAWRAAYHHLADKPRKKSLLLRLFGKGKTC